MPRYDIPKAIGAYDSVQLRDALERFDSNFAELYAVAGAVADITQEATYDASAAHTAIQAALDSASNSVVIVPPGSYTIGATINMVSNKKLIIQKGATITLGDSIGGNMIAATSVTNFHVQIDGMLTGNGANQSVSSSGIWIDGCESFSVCGRGQIQDFRNNAFQTVSCKYGVFSGVTCVGRSSGITSGVGVARSQYMRLSNLVVRDNTGAGAAGYGIYINGTANTLPSDSYGHVIENCVVTNNDDDNFVLFDSRDCIVRECVFSASVSDKGAHIQNARMCIFEDCTFKDNDLAGIALGPAGSIDDAGCIFRRCKFNYNGDDGVEVNGKNNRFIDCEAIGNAGRGFRCYYGIPEGNLWSGGRIGNNTMAGISFEGDASNGARYNTVEKVLFYDTQATKTQDYAVQEGANVGAGNRINNCVILPQQTGHLSLVNGTEGTNHLANEKLS